MNISRPTLAALAALLFSDSLFSQNNCGFDGMRTPAVQKQIDQFEQGLAGFFPNEKESAALPATLPVVVHIVHDGGAENIPDAQILAAIEHLNEAFAAGGFYAQKGATVNTQIQFCLAKRDPAGMATNGITRDQSPLTEMVMETDDVLLKNINDWQPTDYVNIWVVREISSQSIGSGVAGYAYFPSAAGAGIDGLVCEAKFFGTNAGDDAVLIHEMGHYLGLYHTFEGGCKNDNCALDGDRVCDTPPDQAKGTACPYNSCSTDVTPGSPFLTDVDDPTGDFMDYSPFPCYYFFTAGQAARMQATVMVARKSLLASKGCQPACSKPIAVGFTAVPNPVLAGQSVVLTNTSTGATAAEWSENGDVFSNQKNATRSFSTLGDHPVKLWATNFDPNCGDSAIVHITVLCPVEAGFSTSATAVEAGATVSFTNQSAGGATDFEWSVNGFKLSTAVDFGYEFQVPGSYVVRLVASGGFCSKEKSAVIQVKSPCGEPVDAELKFSEAAGGAFDKSDLLPLPDGSTVFGGSVGGHPFLMKMDAGGQVVWQKGLAAAGKVVDLEPLPDGQFLASGERGSDFFVAKIDGDGNFTWFKTIAGKSQSAEPGVELMAVLPDGSFYFLFDQDFGSPDFLGKVSPSGTLEWTNAVAVGQIGGLRMTVDGSNDVLLSALRLGGAKVYRYGQTGGAVGSRSYALQGVSINRITHPFLGVHPNGDYSLIFGGSPDFGAHYSKYLIRCKPNGLVRWAGRIDAPGVISNNFTARYRPGLGWLVADNKGDAVTGPNETYLLRLGEDDKPVWQRKTGNGTGSTEPFSAMSFQKGLVRAAQGPPSNPSMRLLTLPDDGMTVNDCLPIGSLVDEWEELQVTSTGAPEAVLVDHFQLLAEVPVFDAGISLTREAVCNTVFPCLESCENGVDDDGDNLIDCLDEDCPCSKDSLACSVKIPAPGSNPLIFNKLPVPDASLTVDSVRCRLDSFEVYLRICNLGSAVLPAHMPISFYNGNPTATAAPLLFPPVFFDEKLAVGECRPLKLTTPAAVFGQPVFVVANDDGSTARPFVLTKDTISTGQPECHFSNNIGQFLLKNPPAPLDLGPDRSVCKSSVVKLSAGPFFKNYRWQDGSGDSTFTAFGAGKYWVNAFDICGFRQTDTVLIKLDSAAALGLPTAATLCDGDTISFSAAPGFDEYSWSPASVLSCAKCPTPTFLGKATTTLFATGRKGSCFTTDSVRVNLRPNPSVEIALTGGGCGGLTATASGEGPFQFSWSSGQDTSAITASKPGTYVVNVSDVNGCTASGGITISVIDDEPPTLTCPPDLTASWCSPVVAYAAPVALDNCLIYGGQFALVAGLPSGAAFPIGQTWNEWAFTDNAGNVGGCAFSVTVADSLTINVLSKTDDIGGAGVGSISVAVGGGKPGYLFVWEKDGASFSTSQNLTGLKTGNYVLKVVDANGCSVLSASVFIDNIISTGEPDWASGLVLRPNPSPGSLEICFQKETDGPAVEVFDAAGRLVGSFCFERSGRVFELDLSGVAAGFYQLKIESNGRAAVRKLVRL